MLILGIDPGYDRLGVALIKKEKGKEELVYSDCFLSSKKDTLGERLLMVGDKLEKVIKDYKPDSVATEKLYFTVNQKTAMAVAEARGVISYLSAKYKIPLFEYTPPEIKLTVTGYGNANKKQVTEMVPRLINMTKEVKYDDEYDAVAIALTHLAIHPNRGEKLIPKL
ncbi:MAG TPA: crossover junction endodeoxyribonuclease RuvC [Candidatus Paceibacterota bacterium]|nr:crossover junction endodeoxyribonuclease RuvC [Candidatus Paceibacterota bacterium]